MQTYLPFIKDLLSEWYLFTLNNALYAAALTTAVWLLTAMFYSIRIAAIKRKKIASEKTGAENLHTAQQQLQHTQEELATTLEQIEQAQSAVQDETQRALTLEQLIYQRNQQIAGIIQTLATSFDLGERPLLATEDIKADSLWQQHDKVISQLIDRLRAEQQAKIELQQACQTESAKAAEKEALVSALQTTLNNHTSQLSKLEQALEEQKSMLQQQNTSQQALSDTLKNYQTETARPAEPEQIKPVNIPQQSILPEEPPITAPPLPAQPERIFEIKEEIKVAAIHHNEEPQIAMPWESPIELAPPVEKTEPLISDIKPQPTEEAAPYASLDVEQRPVTHAKGSLGKIKNLFGKKPQPVKTEPQWTPPKSDEPMPTTAEQLPEDESSKKTENKPGKLKGFYSKFKSKNK